MNTVLLIVLILYIFIAAYWSFKHITKLMKKPFEGRDRIKLYRTTILEGWTTAAVVVLIVIFTEITASDLGINIIKVDLNPFHIWLTAGIFLICGILLLLLLYQILGFLISEAYREQLRKVLEKQQKKESHYTSVISEIMLPKKKSEKYWFTFVSITAGIGEEIVYRGFLFYLLTSVFPSLTGVIVLLLGGLIFGVAHSYQGLSGCLKTGLLGILLGALYLASGSLIPGMLLHFIIDFSSNFMSVSQTDESNELKSLEV